MPTLVLRPSRKRNGGSTQKVIEVLSRILINPKKKTKFHNITHLVVEDVHKFDDVHNTVQLRGCQLDNIVSLKMSFPLHQQTKRAQRTTHFINEHRSFPTVLDAILPNVETINVSNTVFGYADTCRFSGFYRKNLKQIMMDNTFYGVSRHALNDDDLGPALQRASDLHNYPNEFLFARWSASLVRVSIRNVKYVKGVLIPQDTLIKFVRNAPSLRWFRSDLTQENMEMLRLEKPNIQFLN